MTGTTSMLAAAVARHRGDGHTPRTLHVAVAALTGFLSLVVPAAPAHAATAGEPTPATPATYTAPTPEALTAKQAEVAALAAQVTDQQAAMDAAMAQVASLQDELETAYEAEAEAIAAEEAATAEQQAQTARLEAATVLAETRRDEAGQWASKTYRDGSLADVARMMSVLQSSNTDDMAQRMQMLDLVGRWRGSVVDTVEEARAVQADATARAQAAADAAVVAHTNASAARATAESTLSAQSTQLMLIQTLLSQSQAQQAAAQASAASMSSALAAQTMSITLTSDGSNVISGPVDPNCPGGDISGYPNGQIPQELLCPLYGASGHKLRADAAKAFNEMSAAYALQFGAPICVTDSYRTLAGQIAVKAAKPGLAAKPGTSRHGLARAVDLCGGLQSFNTPQHNWMRANAPRFGWCDPVWARANGSKPEAWHWQYMDCVH